jgi:type II secretory pathway pseudopilin PulG
VNQTDRKSRSGFTLIELSMMLVIIGLLIGGVLVGQDLISSAAARAQISQIEKYDTATNTFKGKYGYIPGDIPDPYASQFGLAPRGTAPGQGDGNGVLQGCNGLGTAISCGELSVLFADLAQSGFVSGVFTSANITSQPPTVPASGVGLYFPAARIGGGNFVYVFSGGTTGADNINYFGLSSLTQLNPAISTPAIAVQQAYAIDRKIDDAFPQSNKVTAIYKTTAGPIGWIGASDTSATSGSATTCYDNGGVGGSPQQYSMEISKGSNTSCALSFKMQGAAR